MQDDVQEAEAVAPDAEPRPTDDLAFIKRVLTLLVLACLAVSACLNVYLIGENLVVKRQARAYAEMSRGRAALHQFCQRVVTDLRQLSGTNEAARQMLYGYRRYMDSPARPMPDR